MSPRTPLRVINRHAPSAPVRAGLPVVTDVHAVRSAADRAPAVHAVAHVETTGHVARAVLACWAVVEALRVLGALRLERRWLAPYRFAAAAN